MSTNFTNDEIIKILTVRQVIHNVNLKCDPRPERPIAHFTEKTRLLLSQLRQQKPRGNQ
jgi:hypothetical protein